MTFRASILAANTAKTTEQVIAVLADIHQRLLSANSALAVNSAAQIVDELRTNLSNQKGKST